jgi:hypothetical protein
MWYHLTTLFIDGQMAKNIDEKKIKINIEDGENLPYTIVKDVKFRRP